MADQARLDGIADKLLDALEDRLDKTPTAAEMAVATKLLRDLGYQPDSPGVPTPEGKKGPKPMPFSDSSDPISARPGRTSLEA